MTQTTAIAVAFGPAMGHFGGSAGMNADPCATKKVMRSPALSCFSRRPELAEEHGQSEIIGHPT